MSFSPLPPAFASDLAGGGRLLELGCGDGRFTRRLRRPGWSVVTLDRRPPRLGSVAAVVGDARRPPLRERSFRIVVAANLLRFLVADGAGPGVVTRWRRLLVPGGSLFILEDEPSADTPARRHYRDLQELLARLVPGRPPLWPWRRARRWLARANGGTPPHGGVLENREPPPAADDLRAAFAAGGAPPAPLADLLVAVAKEGIDYGRYWWCRLPAPGEETRCPA